MFKNYQLSEKQFNLFKELIYQISGIHMKPEKRVLVENRLAKRVRFYQLNSYEEYYKILRKDDVERQMFIDIITTNETSFFRESHHFDYLKSEILPTKKSTVRIWSAACSIGAEAYSAAMVCEDYFKGINRYEIICTDINSEVLKTASIGLYPEKFLSQIPNEYIKKFCLKGRGKYEGNFIFSNTLKSNFYFKRVNLMEKVEESVGDFDVIFLRNMLIYFDKPEKKHIVENIVRRLKRGGILFLGHSESLFNITDCVEQLQPTIYIKR